MHKVKSAPIFGFKALVDEGPGVFEAIVSVFGNVDLGGDRILAGAFAGSLERWKSSGDPIPVVWSHQWDDLDAHVGGVLEAEELLPGDARLPEELKANGGLWVKFRLDVDDPEEPFARRLAKRLEKRRIREFSFAYDVIDERRSTDGANDLVELDVIEVGPTLKGMNPATALLARAKSTTLAAAKLRELGETTLADELVKSIPPHAYIPGAEDPDHCTVCGMTRPTTAHLHTLSADPAGAKAVVDVAGSVEQRQRAIYAAAADVIPVAEANGGLYELALEATFEDRAVFRVEGWDDPIGGGRFYEVDVLGFDGSEAEVGEPREVVVEGVVREKAAKGSAKAARPVGSLRGDRDGKSRANVEEPPGVKAEELEARTGSDTGDAARALLELDVLELDSEPAPS